MQARRTGPRPARAAVRMSGALWCAVLLVSCTQEAIRPVPTSEHDDRTDAVAGAARPARSSSSTTSTTTTSTAGPSVGSSASADSPGPTPEPSDLVDQIDLVLDRYDDALTQLAAEPSVSTLPEDPRRQAWEQVVVAGTALSEGLLAQVREDALEGTRLLPGPGGRSYRHHALVATELAPGHRQFTWCSYSAGVRVRAGVDPSGPGAVVDDGLGHAHGVGDVVDAGAGWQLTSLDQLELSVLPPGSTDPCVAEKAAAGGGSAATEHTP